MNKKVSILVVEYQWERSFLRALLMMLILLTTLYLYFVATSILNVIALREANVQSTRIESAIGLLEQRYFALSQDLTPAAGSALGLSNIRNQSYVYREGNVGHALLRQGYEGQVSSALGKI